MANELDDVVGATQNENWLLQLIDANSFKIKVLEQRVQTLEAALKEQQVEISQLLKRLGV